MFPVPEDKFAAVCALLGGVSMPAVAASASPVEAKENPTAAASAEVQSAAVGTSLPDTSTDGDVDAHGWPWDESLHASTKSKTKEGLWRMKVGVTRPEPMPGFPKEATGTSSGTASTTATATAQEPAASATASAPTTTAEDDDDEFAAFRAAAAKADAEDSAAAASIPARKWTDADLGTLCNQAAVKLGDPTPIKEIIGQFVNAGDVAHSRNIPEDKREDFAKAIEAKAGIEFAG